MNDFRPVTDQKLMDRLETSIAPLLDGPWHSRVEELARRSWTAVPVAKGRHVEPEDAERLAAAIRQETSTPCYALATEPVGDQSHCYEVAASVEGLLGFSHECAGLNFILVPLDLAFAPLFTSEDYNVYAGPRRFVEAALSVHRFRRPGQPSIGMPMTRGGKAGCWRCTGGTSPSDELVRGAR